MARSLAQPLVYGSPFRPSVLCVSQYCINTVYAKGKSAGVSVSGVMVKLPGWHAVIVGAAVVLCAGNGALLVGQEHCQYRLAFQALHKQQQQEQPV